MVLCPIRAVVLDRTVIATNTVQEEGPRSEWEAQARITDRGQKAGTLFFGRATALTRKHLTFRMPYMP